MTLFKNNTIFNFRFRTYFIPLFFYLLTVFFFCSPFLGLKFLPPKISVLIAIIVFTLKQLFNIFLFNCKLNVKDDEFLRYKYCISGTKSLSPACNSCHVESLLDIIFSNSPDIITFKDSKLKYAMCSKKFACLAGKKDSSEIIGKTIKDFLSDKNQANILKSNDRYVMKKRVSRTCFYTDYSSSPELKYEVVSTPIISNNEVVGVLTLSRDVTDTCNLKDSLELSNSQLVTLLNNTPMFAYIVDTSGNYILGNDKANRLFVDGVDYLLTGENIQVNPEIFKEEVMAEDVIIKANKQNLQFEKRFTTLDGDRHWYSICKTPLFDDKGNLYAISTFGRSIEQEKRISEQRETYIATLSHDLKTPTIAQVRALELMLSGQFGEFNQEQKNMLKLTLDSCNYMYDMVYTLLSTYKFENGDISLNFSSLNFTKVVKESIKEVLNLAQENSVTVDFSEKSVYKIVADKIEMKRVVINLLSNAINYAFQNSRVSISVKISGKNLEFYVKNSSPYIEPSAMNGLFRKYVSHSDKFNKVGVGLGLYLSKKIVEAHGGKIIAKSFKNQSNIFGFSIPLDCSFDSKPEYLVGIIN